MLNDNKVFQALENIMFSRAVLQIREKEAEKITIMNDTGNKQKILRFIHNQSVSITRKLVKESCYASFYWLNKHECDWLNSCLPKTIRCYKNKRVDWSERDIISSSLINDVLSQGQYSMSLTSLDALLGGHGWLLKYRDKLPMTMILLRKMELIK